MKTSVVVTLALIVAAVDWAMVRHVDERPERAGPELIARPVDAVVVDGSGADAAWQRTGRTGAFTCRGARVCAFAEARAAWDAEHLYLFVYAADDSIRAPAGDRNITDGDHVSILLTSDRAQLALELSPRGTLHATSRGSTGIVDVGRQIQHALDVDGTVDDDDDEDEEWAVELAIPLRLLDLRGTEGQTTRLRMERCDWPAAGPPSCSVFGDAQHPAVLQLEGPEVASRGLQATRGGR